MNEEIFLIDTNILIHAKNGVLGFDLAPSFWRKLEDNIDKEKIKTVTYTRKEIQKQEDELREWFESSNLKCIDPKYDLEIFGVYLDIVNHIENCGYYNESSYRQWFDEAQADPWLIATAKAYNYTLISHEEPNKTRSKKQKQSKNAPKVPDVASDFFVKIRDLPYMMRTLEIIL